MQKHHYRTNFDLIQVKEDAAAELLADLAAEQYDGTITAAVTNQLWLYGWVTLHAHLGDGRIAALGAGPGAREITERDLERFVVQSNRDDLVHTTLEGAVPGFLKGLQQKRYDPDRGTTIATYFAGFAFRRFRTTVHPRWANETAKHEYELGQVHIEDEWYSAALEVPDHAEGVVHDLTVHRAVVQVVKTIANRTERPVALGVLREQSYSEIAAELGITAKAVERRFASLRQKAWASRPAIASSDDAHDYDDSAWWDLAG